MYKKESTGWFKHYDFILLDMLCLQIAFLLAYTIRGINGNPYAIVLYRNMAVFIVFADVVALFFFETLKNVLKRGIYVEFIETLKHVVIVSALCVFYLYFVQDAQEYSRLMLGIMFVIYFILTYTVRQIWKTILRRRMVSGGDRSLLIVTNEAGAAEALQNLKENNYEMFTLSGVVILDRDLTGQDIEGIPVVSSAEDAPMYVCQEWIDEVLILPRAKDDAILRDLVHKFVESGVTVHLNLAQGLSIPGQKQLVEKVGNYTVLTTSMNFVSARQLFAKRAMDIVGGLVGCLLTALVFLFVAPAIYISSPGPIFFSQERVGKNGKKFKMYKFRSMYLDAEERKAALMKENKLGDAKMFKMDFDPRVIGNKILPDGTRKTGIGNFIRSTSLDEFPQFFNVLKGDMSIVGTRPPLIGEVSEYELHHRARLAIKPGITGMWQVSGRSDITDFEEVVKLDTQYISEWSIGLDIKILFKTLLVVFKKEGSV
ncbi:sugar transferase [Candidatus Merdisoma sp. HCP28S3_D10]|uniref:sugar transferase n=1 Tax=unclassified Candidatus Merdisoma TaxID=3099611 RepID=UPI003F8B346A